MFRRAWISVIRNKGRTIILAVLLLVIANLVLSSLSIKSATEEAIIQARLSLDPTVTLTTNREDIFEYVKAYKEENGVRPSQEEINALLVPITSDIAFGIIEDSTYVKDFNFSYTTSSTAVNFLPLTSDGILDEDNTNKISIIGTYNPLLLNEFADVGSNTLTDDSATFYGDDTSVAIISYNLASENNLIIGDSIELNNVDGTTQLFTIVGTFYTDDILDTNSKSISDNDVYIPLNDALVLSGQDPNETFTITTAVYYLYDPLDIDPFIAESTLLFDEISSGDLMFSDVNYDAITDPLESVGSFSELILWLSVIAAIVILTLLIINSLKERKYEIGVLLSLGEQKLKISLQYLMELSVIAVAIFTLSAGTSMYVSDYLGDMLLTNEITTLTATEDTTTTTTTKGGGIVSDATITAVDYSTLEIDVQISFTDFALTLGIGLGIILLSSVIPTLYISRYQPKKILSSRQ